MEALRNFANDIDRAGYVYADDIVQIAEFENAYVFICSQNEGPVDFLVGVYWKEAIARKGDYESSPRFEGSLHQCRDKFVEVCCEFVPHLNSKVQGRPGKR